MTGRAKRPGAGQILADGRARAAAGAALILLSALAALDVGLAAAAGRSAGGCIARFSDPATVAVTGAGLESADAAAARAREILAGLPGVRRASILDPSECDAGVVAAMGVPPGVASESRLLAVEGPAAGLAQRLAATLRAQNLSVRVDDHRWPSSPLARALVAVAGGSVGAGLLLCLVTGLVCARMTRAEWLRNHIAVGLLFAAGAEDGFIVGLFRGRAWRLGLWAAALGVAAGDATLGLWSAYGPPSVLDALRPLTRLDAAWSAPWPLISAALAAVSSGAAARRLLRTLP